MVEALDRRESPVSATETVEAFWVVDFLFWPILQSAKLILVLPQSKLLACGDIGIGAMAEVATIADVVRKWGEDAAGSM